MKRDLDRIRELLLQCEAAPERTHLLKVTLSDFDRYQIDKMAEAGLIEINNPTSGSKTTRLDNPYSLRIGRYQEPLSFEITWAGHDYIEAIRDDGIWQSTKAKVKETGGNATLEIVKALAIGLLKKKISQHTDVEL